MKKLITILTILASGLPAFSQLTVGNLRIENLVNPIGLDNQQPRFSWIISSDLRNTMQTAYEIRVGTDPAALQKNKNIFWTSGHVTSDASVYVPYGGLLASGQTYYWQVRINDNHGRTSPWSSVATWQMGFLSPADWKASWISPGYEEPKEDQPSPYLRKIAQVAKGIKKATLYVTSLGLYEVYINGQRVGQDYLTPGWTAYQDRIQYQVYDVTQLLHPGSNAMGARLGSGWYRGFIGFSNSRNFYGRQLALLMQVNIEYINGKNETLVTDNSWKCSTGSIITSEIYHGEMVDARKEPSNWTMATFDDRHWTPVKVLEAPKAKIIATYNEPIRKHETFKPKSIITTPKGEKVVDFGQNLVGWVQIKVSGQSGEKFTVGHAEVLDKEGNFYTENLRPAKQLNTYILKGGGEEIFEPTFTFQGFRYIRLEGYPGQIKPENFTATALYSDMERTGNFVSSNLLINQLQHNIQWGQRGNFLDVPTDCPQRDERLGWTGDAQAFARTASFNFGVRNFMAKWLKDVAADQNEDGRVPFVVPNVLGKMAGGSAGWADAATVIPWDMYLAYGDVRILEEQYPSMKKWVEFMRNNSKDNLWNTGFHFGDWLFYRPFDDNDGRAAVTDKYLIAQCFYAYSTQLLINAARVLGRNQEVNEYTALLKTIKEAFMREYMTATGRLVSGTQTAYVLALNFDMLPETLRASAAERLVENIRSYGYHLTTGFLGTPYLTHVLTRFGYTDVAYRLLLQESYPSWLYPVKMGATTIWERWDGIKPDSTFQTPSMNSFNHYAYGAIGDWMYRIVAGLDTDPLQPGYKHITIRPHLQPDLEMARADLKSYYGEVTSRWRQNGGVIVFEVKIPVNTRATIYLPAKINSQISLNNQPLNQVSGIKTLGLKDDYFQIEVGSGTWEFVVR